MSLIHATTLIQLLSFLPVTNKDSLDSSLRQEAEAALAQQDWSRASELFFEYLLDQPEDGDAHYCLGLALLQSRELETAKESLLEAFQRNTRKAESAYNLACCASLSGSPTEAMDWLRESIRTGNQQWPLAWYDPDLRALQHHAEFVQLVSPLQGHYRDFDFWVGEWTVFDATGRQVGTNSIQFVEGGAGLLERWVSTQGTTGTSMSYFDPVPQRWTQSWLTAREVSVASGGMEGRSMVLASRSPEGILTSRTTWTPLEDGRVRQHWEKTADGGKTWQTEFDGYYSRNEN